MKKIYDGLPVRDYTIRFSVSIVYAILASIAMDFFYQPGNIYSSDLTGLAQILTTLSAKIMGLNVSVSITSYLLNVPLFFITWKEVGKKSTTFTFITVALTSLFIHIVPQTVMIQDPIICAIFGRAISGSGIGSVLKNGVSSRGLDILSVTIRKKTGRSVGSISIYFSVLTVSITGYLSGWRYMSYSALSIFASGKITGAIYTKQKRIRVMIVTKSPDRVVDRIQKRICRGTTIIHEAEGTYRHSRQTVLLTIMTRSGLPSLEAAMKESDPNAFANISDNTKILGRFYEEDYK